MSIESDAYTLHQYMTLLDKERDSLQTLTKDVTASDLKSNIQNQIDALYDYYRVSLNKASSKSSRSSIWSEFENYAGYMKQVKEGKMTAESVIKTIGKDAKNRDSAMFWHNLARMFELLFWGIALSSCITAIVSVGIPLLAMGDVFVGAAVTYACCLAGYQSSAKFLGSLDFRSFERHYEATQVKGRLLQFFMPEQPEENPSLQTGAPLSPSPID